MDTLCHDRTAQGSDDAWVGRRGPTGGEKARRCPFLPDGAGCHNKVAGFWPVDNRTGSADAKQDATVCVNQVQSRTSDRRTAHTRGAHQEVHSVHRADDSLKWESLQPAHIVQAVSEEIQPVVMSGEDCHARRLHLKRLICRARARPVWESCRHYLRSASFVTTLILPDMILALASVTADFTMTGTSALKRPNGASAMPLFESPKDCTPAVHLP